MAQRVLLDFCGGEQSWKLWELFSLHHHHCQNLSSSPQFRVCKPKFTILERVRCPDQYYFLKARRLFPNIGICLLECPRIKLWNLWHRDDFKAEMCSGPPLSYLKFSGWWFSPKKLDALCVVIGKRDEIASLNMWLTKCAFLSLSNWRWREKGEGLKLNA